jgi:5-formaminoimidazole-4-carboxamide-1-beta-D-ribofuranosyl 5'-monophosphate synthetase
MLQWIEEIYIKHTKKDRSLLVIDSFRAHLTDAVKKELRKKNVVQAVIPGGCTSKLQPLDVSINKPFKANFVSAGGVL